MIIGKIKIKISSKFACTNLVTIIHLITIYVKGSFILPHICQTLKGIISLENTADHVDTISCNNDFMLYDLLFLICKIFKMEQNFLYYNIRLI